MSATTFIPHHLENADMDARMNARTQRIDLCPEDCHDEVVRHGERLNVVEREIAELRQAVAVIAEMRTQLKYLVGLAGVIAVAVIGGLVGKFSDLL